MWDGFSAELAWPEISIGKYSERTESLITVAAPVPAMIGQIRNEEIGISRTKAICARMKIIAMQHRIVRGRTPRPRNWSATTPNSKAPQLNEITMTKRRRTLAGCSRPSTSEYQDAAQRPCNAQAVLMHIMESGANRQKRASA